MINWGNPSKIIIFNIFIVKQFRVISALTNYSMLSSNGLIFITFVNMNSKNNSYLHLLYYFITVKSCRVYIDENARVYHDWESYLTNNTLPKCVIIVPENGEYTGTLLEVSLTICYYYFCQHISSYTRIRRSRGCS